MEERTYLVRIETKEFWERDLVFETTARNAEHAITKVAKAFETVCLIRGLDNYYIDANTPLKHAHLAYRATAVPDIDVESLLSSIMEDSWG